MNPERTNSPASVGPLARLVLGLASLAISGCGPLAIGAVIASSGGGGGDGGGGPSTVNFTESEPNDIAPGNLLGPMFPGRTYVVSGTHAPGSGDIDFFRIDATSPVRVQITLTPSDFSDLELLVGAVVDNGGAGAAETFVVDLNTNDVFSAGSREFSDGMSMYTMRLVGQTLAPPAAVLDHEQILEMLP